HDGDRNDDGLRDAARSGPVATAFAHLPAPVGDRVRARQTRGADEAVRIEPEVELASLGVPGARGDGLAVRAVDRPRFAVADGEGLARVLLQRRPAAPTGAVEPRGGVLAGLAGEG